MNREADAMDVKMEDVQKHLPDPQEIPSHTEPPSIPALDSWIDNLMNCKQLSEADVQRLCDKVRPASEARNRL